MSEDLQQTPDAKMELDMLKERAKMMGITHSNNISVETLKAKIEAKMNGQPDPSEQADLEMQQLLQDPAQPDEEPGMTIRDRMVMDKMKMIRVRITNMDPKKKDLPGEIVTVANDVLGTVRKYIPFGAFTDEGYHIPKCIYDRLKKRRFQHIRTFSDPRTKHIRVETSMALEFNIEVLPDLNRDELRKLAVTQAASGNFADN